MRGGALPPALLLAALAFALAQASPRARIWSLAALLGAIAALSRLALPENWLEPAFLGCWISTAATAAAVHLPSDAVEALKAAFEAKHALLARRNVEQLGQ